jgi:hypothetical protein
MARKTRTTAAPARILSWFARYRAVGSMPLLGGVDKSQSCRYGTREEAECRLAAVIQINGEAGRPCEGEVEPSPEAPEIFAHCEGRLAQCLGCKCFGCGVVLTLKIAQEWATARAVEPMPPPAPPSDAWPRRQLAVGKIIEVRPNGVPSLYRIAEGGRLTPLATWDGVRRIESDRIIGQFQEEALVIDGVEYVLVPPVGVGADWTLSPIIAGGYVREGVTYKAN